MYTLLIFTVTPSGRYHHLHFTHMNTDAWRGWVTCSRSLCELSIEYQCGSDSTGWFLASCYTLLITGCGTLLVIPSHFVSCLVSISRKTRECLLFLCIPQSTSHKALNNLYRSDISSYLKRSKSSFWSPISLRKWMRCLRATCRNSSSRKRTSGRQEGVRWGEIKVWNCSHYSHILNTLSSKLIRS